MFNHSHPFQPCSTLGNTFQPCSTLWQPLSGLLNPLDCPSTFAARGHTFHALSPISSPLSSPLSALSGPFCTLLSLFALSATRTEAEMTMSLRSLKISTFSTFWKHPETTQNILNISKHLKHLKTSQNILNILNISVDANRCF